MILYLLNAVFFCYKFYALSYFNDPIVDLIAYLSYLGQKELYNTKKQNINLPTLGRNSKSQTLPTNQISQDRGIRQHKVHLYIFSFVLV